MELFLLNYDITPIFYESEYNQYWQDIMFQNKELKNFVPDIIYIHTTNKNIIKYPQIGDSDKTIDEKLEENYTYFVTAKC